MAVRFLPGPEERGPAQAEDRHDLAEVIELRGALKQRSWGESRPSTWERRTIAEAWAGADDTSAEADRPAGAGAPVGTDARVGTDAPEGADASGGMDASDAAGPPGEADGQGAAVFARGKVDARIVEIAAALSAARSAASAASAAGAAPDDHDEHEAPAPGFGTESEDTGPERTSYEDGVRILGRRARSSGELREELLRLGHDAAEVDAVVDEFERSLYLDDVGLARSVTEKLRDSKRSSRAQIRMKLIGRKLPDSAIETALGELDTDEEFELLREAAADRAKKLSGLDRQTAERRLLGFLARRGWSGEPAMRAARAALDGASRPSGGVRFR